jgi:hypothetical protein
VRPYSFPSKSSRRPWNTTRGRKQDRAASQEAKTINCAEANAPLGIRGEAGGQEGRQQPEEGRAKVGSQRNADADVKFSAQEETFMKTATLTLAILLVCSAGFASAHSVRRHHHHGWFNSMNMVHGPGRTAARTDPNGTAGGPTTVSGTGSSKFGGQIPGARGAARQP